MYSQTNNNTQKKKRGFTLIELLIVVAIIAILAAIAAPNFMEAQVRAKVSRSQADMRSLATAIEAYAVDHNKYPEPNPGDGVSDWGNADYTTYLIPITTPVGYITALPKYTWTPWITWDNNNVKHLSLCYKYDSKAYWDKSYAVYTALGYSGLDDWTCFDNSTKKKWCLAAVGPDADSNHKSTAPSWNPTALVGPSLTDTECYTFPYDSTNGTMSRGDIIRTGP